jgi:hypothetical protein
MLKDIDDIKEDNIAFYVQYDLSLWYEIKLISPKIFWNSSHDDNSEFSLSCPKKIDQYYLLVIWNLC